MGTPEFGICNPGYDLPEGLLWDLGGVSYPDFLPPMFWETRTITNPTKATVEVWGPLIGTIVLGPGEERTVAIPAGEHLSVAKTTVPGSLTITLSEERQR